MNEQKNVMEAEIEATGGAISGVEPELELENAQPADLAQGGLGVTAEPSASNLDDYAQLLPQAADTLDSGVSAPPLQKDYIAEAVCEAVAQTLATLGITSDMVAQQRSLELELEKLIGLLTRSPDDIKNKLENLFDVLLTRLEDPKGIVGYNRQKRFFMDLLSLYDLMQELEDSIVGADADLHRSNYRNLKDHLLQLLALNGVTLSVVQVGEPFSPQQHRVIKVIHTDDSSHDGYIAAVVREGFAFGSFTLRPTEVVVRKCVGGGIA